MLLEMEEEMSWYPAKTLLIYSATRYASSVAGLKKGGRWQVFTSFYLRVAMEINIHLTLCRLSRQTSGLQPYFNSALRII